MEGSYYSNQPPLNKPNKTGTYALIGCLGCAGLLVLVLVIVGVLAVIGASSPSKSTSTSPTAVTSSHMPEEAASGSTAAQPPTEQRRTATKHSHNHKEKYT